MSAQTDIYLTVRRQSPNAGTDLVIPQRKLFPVSVFTNAPHRNTKRGGSVVKLTDASFRGSKKFEVCESPAQINTAIEPASSNFLADAALTVAAAGTTLGGATLLANYYNKVASGTGGVKLPAVAGKGVFVIINASGAAINVYPASTEVLVDSTGTDQAASAAISLANGATMHVTAYDGLKNRVAVDA